MKNKAISLYEEGEKPGDIAQELDLPLSAVRIALKDHLKQEARAKVPDLREKGLTYAQISEETGLSTRTIWKVLKRQGLVTPAERHNLTQVQYADVRYRAFSGEPVADIAEDYGISESYVYKLSQGVLGAKQERLSEEAKKNISFLYLVKRTPAASIADMYNVSMNTVYRHRFRDPVLARRWHLDNALTFSTLKYRFQFRDTKVPKDTYWEVWKRYHEGAGESYEEIAEDVGLSSVQVESIAQVYTENAYRAAWDLFITERLEQ